MGSWLAVVRLAVVQLIVGECSLAVVTFDPGVIGVAHLPLTSSPTLALWAGFGWLRLRFKVPARLPLLCRGRYARLAKKLVVVAAGGGGDMMVACDQRRSPANATQYNSSPGTCSRIECCVYTKEMEGEMERWYM